MTRTRCAVFLHKPLLIFFVIVAYCQPAHATALADFYIQQALDRYFELPDDAQTLSMAGSTGGTCKGSKCIYYNPAGLGALSNVELSGSMGFSVIHGHELITEEHLEQENYSGYFTAAFPLGPMVNRRAKYGVLDIGYSRYDGHTDDSIHTTPDGHRRSISYGIAPWEFLSLGYSFHFYDDQLHNRFSDLHSHSRLLHAWGWQVKPTDDLEFSGMFNLGIGQSDTEDIRFTSNGLSHLRGYAGEIGVSKAFDIAKAALSFDYDRVESKGNLDAVALPVVIGGDEEGNAYNIRLGVERPVFDTWHLRAGIRWHEVESYKFKRQDLESLSGTVAGMGYSGGLGYTQKKAQESDLSWRLDYGVDYLSIGKGAWRHIVTATVPLNL